MTATDSNSPHPSSSLEEEQRPTYEKTSLSEMMNRSTIYNRNEARRIKSIACKDDTRPAPIRVLSGLPGFRTWIRPYNYQDQYRHTTNGNNDDTRTKRNRNQNHIQSFPMDSTTKSSVFQKYENVVHHHHDNNKEEEDNNNSNQHNQKSNNNKKNEGNVITIALASSVGGSLSALMFGSGGGQYPTTSSSLHFSPFTGRPTTPSAIPMMIPVVQGGSAFQLDHLLFRTSMMNRIAIGTTTAVLPISILFTSRAMMDDILHRRSTTTSTIDPAGACIVSSGVAGAARAMYHTMMGNAHPAAWGPEVAAATLYFTMYQMIRDHYYGAGCPPNNNISNNSNKNYSVIGGAGAVSGMLYELIRASAAVAQQQQHHHTTSTATRTTSLMMMRTPPSQSLLSIALRAAPAHALLFIGYETTLSLLR